MNNWNLRDEVLRITHQWHVIIAFALVGTLCGWGASIVWPSSYRATLDLYVGLNAYRSPYNDYAASLAGQSFRMVDDYKNWQMDQLKTLAQTDSYLEEVINRLKIQDPYWRDTTPDDFRNRVDILWRNVGEWHLVVEDDDPQHAVQAVETWGDVIMERVNKSIAHSKQVVALDIQLTNLMEHKIKSEMRLERLIYVEGQLSGVRVKLSSLSGDQIVPSTDHWNILGLVSLVAEWDPIWDNLLDDAPRIGSTSQEYLEWLDGVQALIDEGITILPDHITRLNEQFVRLEEAYGVETENSAGLTSTLVIEKVSGETPVVETVVQKSDMMLSGGILGFFSWVIWGFARISRTRQ